MTKQVNRARIRAWSEHWKVEDIESFLENVTLLEGFYGRNLTVNFEDIEFLKLAKYLTLNKK
jgi:hypothetical protein